MKHALRCLLLGLLAGFFLSGCRSANKVLFRTPTASLSYRLPALRIDVDNSLLMATEATEEDDARKLFAQELRQNIVDPTDTTKFGYVKLQILEATTTRPGRILQAFQMVTLLTPSVLGVPLGWYRTRVRAEVQLFDSQGQLLGTYTGTGQSSVRVAMYHGYSQNAAPRLADVKALRLALDQIRPQLEANAATLRAALLSRGPI